MQFYYKYGLYYKFNKNLSGGAIFNDKLSDVSLHGQVVINKNWTMLLNYMKSDNPYMKQMGMDLDINMVIFLFLFYSSLILYLNRLIHLELEKIQILELILITWERFMDYILID